MHRQFDGMTVVAIALLLFMGFNILWDNGGVKAAVMVKNHESTIAAEKDAFENGSITLDNKGKGGIGVASSEDASWLGVGDISVEIADPDAIAPPYEHFMVTQGPHSFYFGQIAIDITGGKEATIKSPINGVVAALYIDEWGNPTLILENDRYEVTMLHGLYTVNVGDKVLLGQPVGKESNQGNTFDALGRSCRGRDCGYHTHLNIYDKQLGANINPLELFNN